VKYVVLLSDTFHILKKTPIIKKVKETTYIINTPRLLLFFFFVKLVIVGLN